MFIVWDSVRDKGKVKMKQGAGMARNERRMTRAGIRRREYGMNAGKVAGESAEAIDRPPAAGSARVVNPGSRGGHPRRGTAVTGFIEADCVRRSEQGALLSHTRP